MFPVVGIESPTFPEWQARNNIDPVVVHDPSIISCPSIAPPERALVLTMALDN